VVAQYWALARAAAARGFEHYEISNYARPGFRSRHNLTYWRAGEYLAAGPGGCGYVGDVRYGNVKPLARYCAEVEAGTLPVDTHERLTTAQRQAERLILGLRTSDGVPTAALRERAAGDAALARRLDDWRRTGRLLDDDGRTRLSEAGFLLSDALFVDLL
jgi:oxygen-independent coproporphyrinogen-3 oxidase